MSPLHISLLGTFRITENKSPITRIESERGRALLAYLVVESGKSHRRDMLAALLWPEASQASASQNIRRAIYNLRQALEHDSEGSVLLVSRQEVQFNSAAGHQIDVVRVSALLDAAATHAHNCNNLTSANSANSANDPNSPHDTDNSIEACGWCIERLKEAAELYSGDFLASLSFIGGEQFEMWRTQKQEDLHISMMAALTHIASYHKRRREYADAIRYLRQQLTLEPWREEAHYQLIEALARNGQAAEALQQYEGCRRILEDELDIEPSPATTALYRRIQGADPEFSPPKPLNYRPNNLPAQPTALIGREKELADITALLGREDVRLVTLKGPGGTGKTRLALELGILVGRSLPDRFQNGVWLVELATIVEPKFVVSTIAAALGVKEAGGTPLIDTLKSYLKSKRLLLILDNLEQVMGAAIDISQLLSSGPGVKVLCTSRIPLRIRGEREYAVRPLALPDMTQLPSPGALTQYAAVQLFTERATDVNADFELIGDNAPAVAEICVRLDGLPLAIELAAARVRLFSPQALLTRLSQRLRVLTGGAHDLPVRHQTMRGAIAWSYDLLDEGEKQLFRRLAVFQGWRTLEAVEAICSYDNEGNSLPLLELDISDGVQSLSDKSLLQRREGYDGRLRFWMLETLHEYAQEKLEESGECEALKREHALYFMRLAEEAEPELTGKQQTEWLVRLEHDHDNIRAALLWARENGTTEAVEVGLRMAGATWRFWNIRGHFTEGREQMMEMLGRGAALSQPTVRAHRAKALNGAGVLAWSQGDYAAARAMHEESLALRRELGDKRGVAYTLTNLGIVAWSQGDYAAARAMHEESLALKRELGDKLGISYSLNNLGTVAREQDDYAAARALYEESLSLRRELGDKLGTAYTLTNLGTVAYLQRDYAYAHALYEESLTLRQELGDRPGIAYTMNNLGNVAKERADFAAARTLYEESLSVQRDLEDRLGIAYSLNNLGVWAYLQGDYTNALALHEESLALRRELGDKLGIAASLDNLGNVAYAQEHYATARALYEESLAIGRELGNNRGCAISLAGLGRVAVSIGRVEQGTRVLAAVAKLLGDLGTALDSEDRISYERAVDFAREHLGEAEFGGAWRQGLAMTIEQAITISYEQLLLS